MPVASYRLNEAYKTLSGDWFDGDESLMEAFSKGEPCETHALLEEVHVALKSCPHSDHKDDLVPLQNFERAIRREIRIAQRVEHVVHECIGIGFDLADIQRMVEASYAGLSCASSSMPTLLDQYTRDLSWYSRALHSDKSRSELDILVEVNIGLNILLRQRNFSTIELILKCTDPSLLSPEIGLTFAQTTYASRAQLSSWPAYTARLKASFEERAIDLANLIGLVDTHA